MAPSSLLNAFWMLNAELSEEITSWWNKIRQNTSNWSISLVHCSRRTSYHVSRGFWGERWMYGKAEIIQVHFFLFAAGEERRAIQIVLVSWPTPGIEEEVFDCSSSCSWRRTSVHVFWPTPGLGEGTFHCSISCSRRRLRAIRVLVSWPTPGLDEGIFDCSISCSRQRMSVHVSRSTPGFEQGTFECRISCSRRRTPVHVSWPTPGLDEATFDCSISCSRRRTSVHVSWPTRGFDERIFVAFLFVFW